MHYQGLVQLFILLGKIIVYMLYPWSITAIHIPRWNINR